MSRPLCRRRGDIRRMPKVSEGQRTSRSPRAGKSCCCYRYWGHDRPAVSDLGSDLEEAERRDVEAIGVSPPEGFPEGPDASRRARFGTQHHRRRDRGPLPLHARGDGKPS